MLIAHKIALDPNKAQEEYFRKGCGTKLFAWNWGLAEWQRQDKQGGKPSEPALRKHLNSLKREQFYADVQGDQMCGAGSAYRPWRGSRPGFASILVETDDIKPAVGLRGTIGIDLGG